MKKYRFSSALVMLALSSTFFFSCSNNQENGATEETSTTHDHAAEEVSEPANNDAEESAAKGDTVRITLNSNDSMQFDKSEIVVSEGQTVVLTLNHTGTMPVESMGHNFVLLTEGTVMSDFATEAMGAKENDYIPADQSNIIAYTGLLGGGGSDVVTFDAPAKGEYDYLCTFPGHYSIMKGKFIVQ